MSELVTYTRAMGNKVCFVDCDTRQISAEIYSMTETSATELLKQHAVQFVKHNQRQITRVYPKGSRVDSSNFVPLNVWNGGCQMAAVNLQTPDLPCQLNSAFFERNAGCGYVRKPACMRQPDTDFVPFAPYDIDNVAPKTLSVSVISGQFLCDKPSSIYVEVDLYGLPTDSRIKTFRTGPFLADGYNTVFSDGADDEKFRVERIILPDMAFLRFGVVEEGGRTLGQRILPVSHLQSGHKHIVLRNCWNKPLGLPTLFVHIDVQERVGSVRRKPSRAVENPAGAMSLLISELKLLQEADAIVRLEEMADIETNSQTRRLVQRGQC